MADRIDIEILKGKKVMVTGATGYLGSFLVRRLAEVGAVITALARPATSIDRLRELGVNWVRGDITDAMAVREAVQGAEYVFHLATVFRRAAATLAAHRQVHVTGTQLLAQAAAGQPGFKRFIHVSTAGVHGDVKQPPADENSPFKPDDVYQRTKAEAELWIRDFSVRCGLPLTVIRPNGIMGPGETRLLKLFRAASHRWVFLPGRSDCRYHLIHVDDLVSFMLLAAVHPAALGEVFIAGNNESVSFEDFIRIVARELGRNPVVTRFPAWPLFIAAWACEGVCRVLGVEPPLHRRRVAFFTKNRSFDTRKMREKLGFKHRYSNEEGLVQTVRWYVARGWLK
ncbi:MAG: NAD-dependent epimerase/dehydratase family protein [Lentisphaerae bacterium]|nr:NAD-dependent epimerase/dehydratase family protein [Lentisphaerota bacterium]